MSLERLLTITSRQYQALFVLATTGFNYLESWLVNRNRRFHVKGTRHGRLREGDLGQGKSGQTARSSCSSII